MLTGTAAAPAARQLPTATVVLVHGPIALVACPYCRRTHSHNARPSATAVRPSHCTGFRPYLLVQADAA